MSNVEAFSRCILWEYHAHKYRRHLRGLSQLRLYHPKSFCHEKHENLNRNTSASITSRLYCLGGVERISNSLFVRPTTKRKLKNNNLTVDFIITSFSSTFYSKILYLIRLIVTTLVDRRAIVNPHWAVRTSLAAYINHPYLSVSLFRHAFVYSEPLRHTFFILSMTHSLKPAIFRISSLDITRLGEKAKKKNNLCFWYAINDFIFHPEELYSLVY